MLFQVFSHIHCNQSGFTHCQAIYPYDLRYVDILYHIELYEQEIGFSFDHEIRVLLIFEPI
jgi:hypothetical protein